MRIKKAKTFVSELICCQLVEMFSRNLFPYFSKMNYHYKSDLFDHPARFWLNKSTSLENQTPDKIYDLNRVVQMLD